MLSREGVSLKKIREAEGGILLIRPYVTENFVEDPFLDGKPMLLSKKTSDMIFFLNFFYILFLFYFIKLQFVFIIHILIW